MKITEIDYNIQTGKETIIEREETDAEKKARETTEQKNATAQAEAEAKAAAKAAILNRIGLTVDELKTILS